MLTGRQIARAGPDRVAQARAGSPCSLPGGDFTAAVRFLAAVGEAGEALGHHPRVTIGHGYVDLKLVSDDAVYRDDEGTEYVVEWVTQQDVDLARRITEIAADHGLHADPASVSVVELGLDAAGSAVVAPVWAAL